LQLLKELCKHVSEIDCDAICSFAAEMNHRHILEWVIPEEGKLCPSAFSIAACKGNLELLKWMHEEKKQEWQAIKPLVASSSGNIAVCSYVFEHQKITQRKV
jgi:hypothetical protein